MNGFCLFIIISLFFLQTFTQTFNPLKTNEYEDFYCRISPLYIKRMIEHYGHNSETIGQFNWISGSNYWTYLFTQEPNSICKEIQKSIMLGDFNFQYMENIIPHNIKLAHTQLSAIYTKDCSQGRQVFFLDEGTRESLLKMKNYFSKTHADERFDLCDERLFTSNFLSEDFAINPVLKKAPHFNGSHCYSEWGFQSIGVGNFFIPKTAQSDEGKVSNHFEQMKSSVNGGIIQPLFFPKTPETMIITKHADCQFNSLSWHLWKKKASSFVQYNTAITEPLTLPRLTQDDMDCNGNLIPDHQELEALSDKDCTSIHCIEVDEFHKLPPKCLTCKSQDIDQNGVPDQCQDCNSNGISDVFEILEKPELDRNNNGILDSCENVSSHFTGQDCNFDGHDDGLQIFWDPELDKNHNNIIDVCEESGICSYNSRCMTTTKYKCEKFLGGVFHKHKCLFDVPTEEEEENWTEETKEETSPQEYYGSCVVSKKVCIDNIPSERCNGDWDSELECSQRRSIDKIEDNENLKNNIDTFENWNTSSTRDEALFASLTTAILAFSIVVIVSVALYYKQYTKVK